VADADAPGSFTEAVLAINALPLSKDERAALLRLLIQDQTNTHRPATDPDGSSGEGA